MKTVRFSKVVEKSGHPEIYLLLSREDAHFQHALKAGRIMSLLGTAAGSKTTHGEVGYDEKQRAQLLIFPKSLKPFEGSRVVGIDFSIFAEKETPAPDRKPRVAKKKVVKPVAIPHHEEAKPKPAAMPRSREPQAKPAAGKVVHFPTQDPVEPREIDVGQLQAYARQALRALEKNNSVAAYNLLKRIVDED